MYGKIFGSLFTGSMMGVGANVIAVWAYVIAHSHGGQVELNPKLVGVQIGMTPEEVELAVAYLCAPDPASRSKNEGGRRLVREGEYAYRVVNHDSYLKVRNEEERREYNRVKQQEHRAKLRESTTSKVSKRKSKKSTMSAKTEAEEEAEEEAEIPAKGKPREHRLPETWTPTDRHRAKATEESVDCDREAEKFRNHAAMTGRRLLDWDRGFANWLLQAAEYRTRPVNTSVVEGVEESAWFDG